MARRVLVIDDEERIRSLFVDFLVVLGYEPDSVDDPVEGLARTERGGYALVLTDLRMPSRLDGTDVAEALRKQVPGLPVIIVTGLADADMLRERGFRVLEKPVKLPAFCEALEQVLGPSPDFEEAF
jgi:CheY-like chemotaxis protein